MKDIFETISALIRNAEQLIYSAAQLLERWLSHGAVVTPTVAAGFVAFVYYVFRPAFVRGNR
jgi:hypothetical protein